MNTISRDLHDGVKVSSPNYSECAAELGETIPTQSTTHGTETMTTSPLETHPSNRDPDNSTSCNHEMKNIAAGLLHELIQTGGTLAMSNERPIPGRVWNELGEDLISRVKVSGEVADIDQAITCYSQALGSAPDGQEDRPVYLHNLGIAHSHRFLRLGNLTDIEKAIKYQSEADSLTPDGHADKPGRLNNLGNFHMRRFESLGDLVDIEWAIGCQSRAVSLTPDGYAEKPERLGNLGNSHMCRFQRLGDLADMNRAIVYHSQAVSLIPDGHAAKSKQLNNLGISYRCQFERVGELADINRAIECQSRAVSITPDRHTDKPGRLGNLGCSYLRRFERLGNLADVDRAIACQSQAVSLTPDGHAEKPTHLNNLGLTHQSLFKHLGKPADIDRAIECHSQAVSLTPDGHADKPGWLNNLGNSHESRFERLGKLSDVGKAITYLSQAVSLTPDGHTDKPGRLGNLGRSYRSQFTRLGELADIDKAIECQSQAVSLIHDSHAGKPVQLSNLGLSHLSRFQRLGELVDIDRAIECQSQAASITPDGHAAKHARLGDLGDTHLCRFGHLGDLADVDKAIACQSQAVSLIPDGHADKHVRLGNLGLSHLGRSEHLGELPDLDRAIACQSQAVSLITDDHADMPTQLNNLGNSHMRRFERLGEPVDIDKAIACLSQAVSLTPDGHAGNPAQLTNLGNSHLRRFTRFGDVSDMDRALAYQSQAISLTPDGHTNKPAQFNSLGLSHRCRFMCLSDLADIEKSIEYHSQAVSLAPNGHADRPIWLNNLANSYLCRYHHLSGLEDAHKARESYRMAALCPTGSMKARFDSSKKWAALGASLNDRSSLSAYQWTMDLVPMVVWIGSTINRRYEDTQDIGSVAAEAASVAILAKEYGLALEWLEAGRSIIWNQILQLRTPFDDIFIIDPELATCLQKAALALEHGGSDSIAAVGDESALEAAAQAHRRLAEEYDVLLSRARQIPGFHDFMRSKQVAALMPAAASGPVAVVTIYKCFGDALILRPDTNEIAHVPLPDVSDNKVMELQRQMRGYTSRGMSERGFSTTLKKPNNSLESILATLWHSICETYPNSLRYTEKLPVDQLPHITWCTTGALAMLPVHAAGCYDQSGESLFSYAVSSYAPTLSSLIPSASRSLELGSILAISQETTLPATKQELSHIKQHAKELPYLQLENQEATAEVVLDAMEQFSSVHFACHASQNLSQPTESCFYLHDRGLSLAEITRRSLKNKGLAFLSACQTATGDRDLPDEAIHLAAGMLVAGYPTIIATMWSIVDADAPIVADHVYRELTSGGKLDEGRTARALHAAVGVLRDAIGEKELFRWVPYIHIGV